MELLRPLISALAILLSVVSHGQVTSKTKEVFVKSYSEEIDGSYERAIQTIQGIYSETSYECNMRMGWLYYLSKKYGQSIQYYNKAAKLMPKSTEAFWALVNPLSASEKWTELNNNYLKIVKLDPKNSVANYRIGLYYYYSKKYGLAKKYFEIVVNIYPSDFDALHMCGWTNYYLGNPETARGYFLRALLIQPTNQSAQLGLAAVK